MASLITVEQSEENGFAKFTIKFIRTASTANTPLGVSEVFALYNKAYVRFKAVGPDPDILYLYLSMQKFPKTFCKIQIFKVDLPDVLEHVCQPLWSDWIFLGSLAHLGVRHNINIYKAEVYIHVYKYTQRKEKLELFVPLDSTDFLLSTEDGSVVGVHKEYLANSSDVFKTMLAGQWKETDKGLIEMKGVTLKTLEHFVRYLYFGSLPEHDDLRPLLLLASQYCIEDLKAESIGKLVKTVSPENVYSLLEFAGESRLLELSFIAEKKISGTILRQCYKAKEESIMKHLMKASNTE